MDGQEFTRQKIRKEIQSMSSLEKQGSLKELMEGVFLSLFERKEQMYRQLEGRIMEDLAPDASQYQIKTGLVEQRFLDPAHHFMTAMREQDLRSRRLSVGELRQAIAEEGKCLLGTVFLKCDYLDIKDMLRSRLRLSGSIVTGQSHPIALSLERNRDYLARIEHLYHLFVKNGIPWQTVNCPYLFKLVDVYALDLPAACKDKDEIRSFRIDLGGYASSALYDMIPIWNVWHLKLSSTGFLIACKDHKSYEHEIPIAEYGDGYIYLVDGTAEINSVQQIKQKIRFASRMQERQAWDIYSIRSGEEGRTTDYTYPVMENFRLEGAAEWIQQKHGHAVKGRAELKRFIQGLGVEGYLEYCDCEVIETSDISLETYSMNFFFKDEIRENRRKKRLILIFRPGQALAAWLLRDLMSFVVSEVQELYPGFECGGELK